MIHSGKTALGVCNGYSLTELMAVLACVGILVSAAVPSAMHLQKEWTLWGCARNLEASLQWGRMHAISSNTPVLFEMDVARQKYYWRDPVNGDLYSATVRYLSRGVRVAAYPKRPLRFYQHGNAAPAGTYTLEGETGSYSVVVSPGGRIRIQRN
jgi:prepilin-type N-terminal cleavage/methylation domain-containing protein